MWHWCIVGALRSLLFHFSWQSCSVSSVGLGRWRSGESLASQPTNWVSERLCLKNQGGQLMRNDIKDWPLAFLSVDVCTCTPTSPYIQTCTNMLTYVHTHISIRRKQVLSVTTSCSCSPPPLTLSLSLSLKELEAEVWMREGDWHSFQLEFQELSTTPLTTSTG